MNAYFGSGVPSGNGFIDNLHKDRKTKNASFCNMWLKAVIVLHSASFGVSKLSYKNIVNK